MYCTAGYFLDDDCECRQIKVEESAIDAVVLEDLKAKSQRVLDSEELKLNKGISVEGDSVESLKVAVARTFLDITAMTDEVWDQLGRDVIVYLGLR